MDERAAALAAQDEQIWLMTTKRELSAREIAEELGVSERTVTRRRARLGISDGGARVALTPEQKALAKEMLEDGASYAEVGRTVGRHASTVKKHFPGYGWTVQQCVEWSVFVRSMGGMA